MTKSPSKSGPVLDEATFQKLLAAAYVLQEHHDNSKPLPPAEAKSDNHDTDSDTSILAQIVETQHEIQANHLDLDGTTSLVMERIVKITGAQGAAIGILEDGMLRYRSARGVLIGQVGKSVRPEAALSSSTLLHDMILRCPNAATISASIPKSQSVWESGRLFLCRFFTTEKSTGLWNLPLQRPTRFTIRMSEPAS